MTKPCLAVPFALALLLGCTSSGGAGDGGRGGAGVGGGGGARPDGGPGGGGAGGGAPVDAAGDRPADGADATGRGGMGGAADAAVDRAPDAGSSGSGGAGGADAGASDRGGSGGVGGGSGGVGGGGSGGVGGGSGGVGGGGSGGVGGGSGGVGGGGSGGVGGGSAATFPLKVGPTNRYLVGQNNVPFLIAGDSPQCMTAKLTPAEMDQYWAIRASQGYNAAWVNAVCNMYTGGKADGTTFDSIAPFLGMLNGGAFYDISRPNPAFFARVDAAVSSAARYGIVVFLIPMETGGWLTTLKANGAAAAGGYGRFIAQRYVASDNLVWMHGNDFQTYMVAADVAVVRGVAAGIREMDTRHLHTLELAWPISSSLDAAADWASTANPIIQINLSYTYSPTYAQVHKDYARANFMPTAMVEANYEWENQQNGSHITNAHDCRTQYYWTNLAGGMGSFYGNGHIWDLTQDWRTHILDAGGAQMKQVQNLFLSRAWQRLVPDPGNTIVTSGFGTYATTGNAQDNTYATTARTDDGRLVMTYMPQARPVTVDMTKLAAAATGRWYDPTTGAYTAIAGSPFANTGVRTFTPPTAKHADGFDDWVLVLETTPPP